MLAPLAALDERQAIEQIAASAPAGPAEAFYDAIADLATIADRRPPSYAQACRGIYGPRMPGLRDVERPAIRVEGSSLLRPKTLRARPAEPPDGAPPRKDRKLCNPPPGPNDSARVAPTDPTAVDVDPEPWAPRPRPGAWVDPRRVAWGLTEAVRPLGQARQVWCRRALLAGAAGLEGHKHGRLAWTGTETCSSVWACPTCSWRIRSHRGVELSELVRVIRDTTPQTETGLESRAGTGGLMVTLTLRHRWPDDLTDLRRLLTRAWSRFIRGAPFERFKRATGLVGFVRSVEVTHGRRGWHPHLHAMIVGDPGWNLRRYAGQTVETWMRRRWLASVRAEGERDGTKAAHVPSWAHALKLSPIRPGYLEKMGLELVLSPEKRGGHGNRTPWQIADDWRRCHRKRSARLWRTYAANMKGCKFLTWSRALRRWAELGASVADGVVAADRGQPLGSVPARVWIAIRDRYDFASGRSVPLVALDLGELRGIRAALRYCWRQAAPMLDHRKGRDDAEREQQKLAGRGTGHPAHGPRPERHATTAGCGTEGPTTSRRVPRLRQADQIRGEQPDRTTANALHAMPSEARFPNLGRVRRGEPTSSRGAPGSIRSTSGSGSDGSDQTFAAAMLAAVFARTDQAGASLSDLR